MKLNVTRVLFVVALLVPGSALAGPLPTDVNAIPGWKGTSSFSGANAGFNLKVDVDFAVYAPGDFTYPGDPSGGADYVYAYEAINSATGTAILSSLSVGIATGAVPNGSTNISFVGGVPVGGKAPNFSQLLPLGPGAKGSAKWSYTSTLLSPGNNSYILFFTSPYAPQMILASMVGGHATMASAALPSPVPEPGTVALGGLALMSLVAVCVRRKARS